MIDIWPEIALFVTLVSLPGWAALYIARRREDPTTYASMEATIRALSEQVRVMHAEMARLQMRVADLTLGVRVLLSQLTALGHAPDYTIEPEPPAPEMVAPDATSIYNRLVREFNLDELSDLAFRLGIETDELGEETISGRSRALIRYVQRRGRLQELATLMSGMRPRRPHL